MDELLVRPLGRATQHGRRRSHEAREKPWLQRSIGAEDETTSRREFRRRATNQDPQAKAILNHQQPTPVSTRYLLSTSPQVPHISSRHGSSRRAGRVVDNGTAAGCIRVHDKAREYWTRAQHVAVATAPQELRECDGVRLAPSRYYLPHRH